MRFDQKACQTFARLHLQLSVQLCHHNPTSTSTWTCCCGSCCCCSPPPCPRLETVTVPDIWPKLYPEWEGYEHPRDFECCFPANQVNFHTGRNVHQTAAQSIKLVEDTLNVEFYNPALNCHLIKNHISRYINKMNNGLVACALMGHSFGYHFHQQGDMYSLFGTVSYIKEHPEIYSVDHWNDVVEPFIVYVFHFIIRASKKVDFNTDKARILTTVDAEMSAINRTEPSSSVASALRVLSLVHSSMLRGSLTCSAASLPTASFFRGNAMVMIIFDILIRSPWRRSGIDRKNDGVPLQLRRSYLFLLKSAHIPVGHSTNATVA
jgi:hypothetical protein